MLYKIKSIITIFAFALIMLGCGGGGSSDNSDTSVNTETSDLSKLAFKYSDSPTQNHALTILFLSEDVLGEIEWTVVSEPEGSSLLLNKSTDGKSITFTPTEVGDYKIFARSANNQTEKSTNFVVTPEYPYDTSKIKENNGSVNIDEIISVITNQSWVYSTSLSEDEIRTIVSTYDLLTVIGFDSIEGLLVEYDDTDIGALEAIEELKLERGISSVVNRVHEGENAPRIDVVTPDDGLSFDNTRATWHLENIGARSAWEYTTGNSDILIGISDSGYDTNHSELQGRFSELLTSNVDDHGMGVSGAVGALTDNGEGISGINWTSQMVLGGTGKTNLKNIIAKDKMELINCSWSIPGYIPSSFDTSIMLTTLLRGLKAHKNTRAYRKLAAQYPDKLFVWSSGNGIGNGAGLGIEGIYHSPALHYDDNFNLNKLDNVIFVAAMRPDSRLTYYSNYGVSVDLASPTDYMSLDLNNSTSIFGGTSGAAPVVTGVASLIYSLYPGFTGKEVKEILISSATEFVTQKYRGRVLEHPIPRLNAKNALKNANRILLRKVRYLGVDIPNPFDSRALYSYELMDEDFELVNIKWDIYGSIDKGSTWILKYSASDTQSNFLADLDIGTQYNKIDASITLRNIHNSAEMIVKNNDDFYYTKVIISVKDSETDKPLVGASVNIESNSVHRAKSASSSTKKSDSNGNVVAYLRNGAYKFHSNFSSYRDGVNTLTVIDQESDRITLYMNSGIATVGSLSGRIVDINSVPIEDVTVRLSIGEEGNTFATVATDKNGYYDLSNITKINSNGSAINSFRLEASVPGYSTVVRNDVIVLRGKGRSENFILLESDGDDIPVANKAPIARAGEDQNITLPSSVTLDASSSSDSDGTIVSYEWKEGDVVLATAVSFTNDTFTEGIHTITLTITDDDGVTHSDDVVVTINPAPEAKIIHFGVIYGTVISPHTGKVWLDRNLGASQVCTVLTDAACYGDLYQWGRNTDGHEKTTSDNHTTLATNVETVGHGQFIITQARSPYDWANVDIYGIQRQINWSTLDASSVCPLGFRVPDVDELEAETLDVGVLSMELAFNSFLKLPSSGNRYSPYGFVYRSTVQLWTNSLGKDNGVRSIQIGGNYTGTLNNVRAEGIAVRCIKE